MPRAASRRAVLTVVGDSDQSIYAFRGADIRNIVEFERDFPGAKVVLLEQNYRSTQNILAAANAVIAEQLRPQGEEAAGRPSETASIIVGFTGYSQHDEAQFVADEIEALHRAGVAYREIAVFYRTNSQTRALEEIFIRSARAVQDHGRHRSSTSAPRSRTRWRTSSRSANPPDELALRRILNTPKRGIGPTPPRPRSPSFAGREGPHVPRRPRRRRRRSASAPRSQAAITAPRRRCSPRRPRSCCRRGGELAGRPTRGEADGLHAVPARARAATSTRCAPAATRRTRRAPRTSRSSSRSPASSRANNPEGTLVDFLARGRARSRTPTTSTTRRARCRS